MLSCLERCVSEEVNSEADASLLERLARRDPAAMAQLYERYARLVYLKLNQIVNDQAAAEDLVQEVFLTIWMRAGELDPARGTLRAWLRATAHNRAVDYLRARGRLSGPNFVDLEKFDIADPQADLEREMASGEPMRKLLGKLDDRHRKVILLAFYQGLSQSEMAVRMCAPLGTVKGWMRQALAVLRRELLASQCSENVCRAASRLRRRGAPAGRRKTRSLEPPAAMRASVGF
jgi:RNA polymerase sigma-70 factor (ECF subfamily)